MSAAERELQQKRFLMRETKALINDAEAIASRA
jgi:hypothetical protein